MVRSCSTSGVLLRSLRAKDHERTPVRPVSSCGPCAPSSPLIFIDIIALTIKGIMISSELGESEKSIKLLAIVSWVQLNKLWCMFSDLHVLQLLLLSLDFHSVSHTQGPIV